MMCGVAHDSDVLIAVKIGVFVVSWYHVIVEMYHFWLAVMTLIVASWGIDVYTIDKLLLHCPRILISPGGRPMAAAVVAALILKL